MQYLLEQKYYLEKCLNHWVIQRENNDRIFAQAKHRILGLPNPSLKEQQKDLANSLKDIPKTESKDVFSSRNTDESSSCSPGEITSKDIILLKANTTTNIQ